MAKKRSRKQKQQARHTFTIKHDPASSEPKDQLVKGQSKNDKSGTNTKASGTKKAQNKAKGVGLTQTKREIVKSVGLASLVLGLEVVIYLITVK